MHNLKGEFFMFYDNYVKRCNKVSKAPSTVAIECGISKVAVSHWKNSGNMPTDKNLQKLSDYFSNYFECPVDYLLNGFPDTPKLPQIEEQKKSNESNREAKIKAILENLTDDQLDLLIKMLRL